MDRREAVKSVAFLIGGALSATTIATLFDSCNTPGKNSSNLFTADQEKLVTEIADIIIPTTSKSPGAKAANVGPFITMMIKDCYPEEAQNAFVKGLEDIEERSKKDFGKSFLEISVKERQELITKVRDETIAAQKTEKDKIDQAAKLEQDTKGAKSEKEQPGNPMAVKDKPKTTPQFFAIARDLTMLGFFTSEIGATQAYEYIAIPGRYDGDVKMKPGQKVYA
ncbi:gluconate 2-dehydrogenase subunit 3 family protein [Pedobacter frigiditerrae]|uniref:Gluconate 2-dehydrogenase subunit 3 family protein n=1 Tax=Pedobacter frigiditerrae TaxID=2530452 RepID=A0A4V2MJJ7_9SPHI|nr:gluconate 2-dehydrogenase subunit 3 family protein [Pedobacter frigiditerrae]TCC94496.1 gluconate 2-dehydrogenase subunit 3 family protein [Pedobacter frigiditerrae]